MAGEHQPTEKPCRAASHDYGRACQFFLPGEGKLVRLFPADGYVRVLGPLYDLPFLPFLTGLHIQHIAEGNLLFLPGVHRLPDNPKSLYLTIRYPKKLCRPYAQIFICMGNRKRYLMNPNHGSPSFLPFLADSPACFGS